MNPLERIANAASGAVNQAAASTQRGVRNTFSRQRLQDQVAAGATNNSTAVQSATNAVNTGRALARNVRRARTAALILTNPVTITIIAVVTFFLIVILFLGAITNISGNDNVQTAVAQAKERGCDFAKGCQLQQYLEDTGCQVNAEQLAKTTDATQKLAGQNLKDVVCPSSASSSSASGVN